MKKISQMFTKLAALRGQKGFTMIELLIVIAILGILAVAVLSAINPLEQINRGRDTGSQSDAEQMLNAIERFNAFQGHYPWDTNAAATPTALPWTLITNTATTVGATTFNPWVVNPPIASDAGCTVLDRLGAGGDTGAAGSPSTCIVGANELKESYLTRIAQLGGVRGLYIYKQTADATSDMYVCFSPQSKAFAQAAASRCDDAANLPGDFPTTNACTTPVETNIPMVCLP